MALQLSVNGFLFSDVDLVIFDKDGTLIDLHTYWSNMIKMRADLIRDELSLDNNIRDGLIESMGVRVKDMRVKPEGPVGLKKRELVLKAGVYYLKYKGLPDYTDLFMDIFNRVDNYSLSCFDKIIKPLPGVTDLIPSLKRSGCCIALATTDVSSRAAKAMEHLGLLNLIDCIAGAEDVDKPKPSPEIIRVICNALGKQENASIMIGDSESDIEAGLNARCMASIGVETGQIPKERLLMLTPYVIKDIRSIIVEGDHRA